MNRKPSFDRFLFAFLLLLGWAIFPAPALARQDSPVETDESIDEEIDAPPPIVFEPSILDFGFVKPGSVATGKVKIKNTSDKPLTILAVQAGCKCTTLNDLSGEEIPPGGFVELEPQMKAQASTGPKKTEIKVLIDGWSRIALVTLKAEISRGVRAAPGTINAVDATKVTGRLVIESIDGKPFSVCAIHGEKPEFVGYDPSTSEPVSKYLVNYDLNKFGDNIPRFLVIETNHPEARVVEVPVRHRTTLGAGKFALRPTETRVNLDEIKAGEPKSFEIEFESVTQADPLLTVMYSNPNASVKLEKTETRPGEDGKELTVATVSLTPKADAHGLLYGEMIFYTQSREQPIHVFGVVGKAECGERSTASAGK